MVVKSATKKWLMDGGMPEFYAHILADDRRPFAWKMHSISTKAITEMNYEEIVECILESQKIPFYGNSDLSPFYFSKELYAEMGEILQRVKKYWLQRYEEYLLEDDPLRVVLIMEYGILKDWDIKKYGLRAGYWEFMNWTKNPFQTK